MVYCHSPYYGTNGKTCYLDRYNCLIQDDNGKCTKYVEGYTPNDSNKDNNDEEMTKINTIPLIIIISVIVLFALIIFFKPF